MATWGRWALAGALRHGHPSPSIAHPLCGSPAPYASLRASAPRGRGWASWPRTLRPRLSWPDRPTWVLREPWVPGRISRACSPGRSGTPARRTPTAQYLPATRRGCSGPCAFADRRALRLCRAADRRHARPPRPGRGVGRPLSGPEPRLSALGGGLAALAVAAGLLVAGAIAAAVRRPRPLEPAPRRLVVLLVAALLAYSTFFCFWQPYNPEILDSSVGLRLVGHRCQPVGTGRPRSQWRRAARLRRRSVRMHLLVSAIVPAMDARNDYFRQLLAGAPTGRTPRARRRFPGLPTQGLRAAGRASRRCSRRMRPTTMPSSLLVSTWTGARPPSSPVGPKWRRRSSRIACRLPCAAPLRGRLRDPDRGTPLTGRHPPITPFARSSVMRASLVAELAQHGVRVLPELRSRLPPRRVSARSARRAPGAGELERRVLDLASRSRTHARRRRRSVTAASTGPAPDDDAPDVLREQVVLPLGGRRASPKIAPSRAARSSSCARRVGARRSAGRRRDPRTAAAR